MAIKIFLDELHNEQLHLEGELTPTELALALAEAEALMQPDGTLAYALTASESDDTLIVFGRLQMDFTAECGRCLKPFTFPIDLPQWAIALPLTGDDAIEQNDGSVDLTPWLREDILLGLPQHPLCGSACEGLVFKQETPPPAVEEPSEDWSKLDDWKQPKS
jgi:uncharacterized metal-binding protein YceD (DUF177 family)|tara:strand:+ start:654 stop:1139 length:486 start_codon:yes stop_codon:yes gene_type:complete